MRIRFKKWARPELEASKFYVAQPEEYKEKWNTAFPKKQPIFLELGCGKGKFISTLASNHLDHNFIAIDLIDAMLGLAKRNIEQAYSENHLIPENILITRYDIERIQNIFGSSDEIERIYINFCNPWPRGKHHKKRLTHSRQLEKYKTFLKRDGEIFFKTDDENLFLESLKYFEEAGFSILKKTEDLAKNTNFWENIPTEHEEMFISQGIKIKALIAINKNDSKIEKRK